MAEQSTATASKTESKDARDKDAKAGEPGDGSITYEDHGTHWIEIDNRGEHTVRTRLVKSLREVPVTPRIHEEVKERMKAEDERKQAEIEQEGLAQEPPPIEEADRDYESDPVDVVVTQKGEAKKSGEDK